MSFTHFLIYRQCPFENMNSSRSQREGQEMLSVKAEFTISCSVSVLTSCDSRSQEKNMTPGEQGGKAASCPLPLHYNQSKRQEIKQTLLH